MKLESLRRAKNRLNNDIRVVKYYTNLLIFFSVMFIPSFTYMVLGVYVHCSAQETESIPRHFTLIKLLYLSELGFAQHALCSKQSLPEFQEEFLCVLPPKI